MNFFKRKWFVHFSIHKHKWFIRFSIHQQKWIFYLLYVHIGKIQTEMVFSKQTSFEFKQKRFFPNRNRSNSNRNGFFQTDIVRVQTEEVFSKQKSFEFKQKWFFPNRHRSSSNRRGFFQTDIIHSFRSSTV